MHTRRGWIIGVGAAGVASLLPAAQGSDWTQFRGPDRTNISKETGLLRKWPAAGPKILWSVPVTQGYAAAAIVGGRVYHHDYDEAKSEWCINCRSLADGKLVWQFREARDIRPNHAITRTIPAVDSRFVCSLDPKAVLHCLDVKTGKVVWRKSLVTEYKTTIPSWYNGQCPLQEADRLIIATGGTAIMAALDNALNNRALQQYFAASPVSWAARPACCSLECYQPARRIRRPLSLSHRPEARRPAAATRLAPRRRRRA